MSQAKHPADTSTADTSILACADIIWQSDQHGHTVPISSAYDDVYYSQGGGLDETTHVFLMGNHLPERFLTLPSDSPSCFIIGETGFGTGLNFLATCELWLRTAPASARLHFISTEKHPVAYADMVKALAAWDNHQAIRALADKLLSVYPLPMAGCHRLHLSDNITLDLWFGEALATFDTLISTQTAATHHIDAWFLDGFTPAKNDSLWTQDLFDRLYRLSHARTTLATFTAAGFVRRGLIASGFNMIKAKGYGTKREMLKTAAEWLNTEPNQAKKPAQSTQRIAIIGAGISGVMAAGALIRRGHSVTLYDKNLPMSGASGNPAALFAPKLTIAANAPEHLPTVGFLYAKRFYDTLQIRTDIPLYQCTGVIDMLSISHKSAEKHQALIASYPDALIRPCQMSDITASLSDISANTTHPDISTALIADLADGFSAYLPMGGLLYPPLIYQALKTAYPLTFSQATVHQIADTADGVTLSLSLVDVTQMDAHHDKVVIAAGYMADALDDKLFTCRKIRGQLSWLWLANNKAISPLKYEGYCTMAPNFYGYHDDGSVMYQPSAIKADKSALLMGASFIRNDSSCDVRDDENTENLAKLLTALPNTAAALGISDDSLVQLQGRASIRAQTPDYHPIIGKLPHRSAVYAMYGMGSKGFSYAPLCAEVLADIIDGGILPVSAKLLAALSPERARLKTALDTSR